MNILLTGSSGFIGTHILNRLLDEEHTVTAAVRSPSYQVNQRHQNSQHPHLNFIKNDFMQATSIDDWLNLLKDIDVVINAVGIISENKHQSFKQLHSDAPATLFSAAEKAGVKKVIQISALGADHDAQSDYHLSKLIADDVLASLSLDWFILRPSMVYGRGASSMGLFRAMAVLPIIPLIEGGTQKMQPVHIDDLVDVVLQCIDSDQKLPKHLTVDVVGPDEITMKELLEKQRCWLGLKQTKTFSTPLAWMLKLMPFTSWLNEPALTADSLKMLQRGNTADESIIQKLLGRKLKSMDEILIRSPATEADRWYARYYFIPALLRLGIISILIGGTLILLF